jgi:hypothetical protein
MVDAMPVAILLIILMIISAFLTRILIYIPLNIVHLITIPTWLLLTVSLIFLSWFLAD